MIICQVPGICWWTSGSLVGGNEGEGDDAQGPPRELGENRHLVSGFVATAACEEVEDAGRWGWVVKYFVK